MNREKIADILIKHIPHYTHCLFIADAIIKTCEEPERCRCNHDYSPGKVIEVDELFPKPICSKCHLPINAPSYTIFHQRSPTLTKKIEPLNIKYSVLDESLKLADKLVELLKRVRNP